MATYNERFQQMSFKSEAYLLKYADITAKLPAFAGYFTKITQTNAAIRNLNVLRNTTSGAGQTVNEDNKVLLISETRKLVKRMVAFATNTSNNELLKQVNYTNSDLKRVSEKELTDTCQALHGIGQAYVDKLADYGVTADSQAALQTIIDNFMDSWTQKGVNKTSTVQQTMQENEYIKVLQANWEKVDVLVDLVQETQPEFYAGYQVVRKLPGSNGHTLVLKVKTVDAASGEPVANVTLTLIPVNGTAGETVTKKTATGGGSNISELEDGDYTLKAKKPGFKELTQPVSVVNGEMVSVIIKMEKA
jgi:hypothetical protein